MTNRWPASPDCRGWQLCGSHEQPLPMLAWQAYRVARVNYDNLPALVPANAATIRNHMFTGLLMSLGYGIELMLG